MATVRIANVFATGWRSLAPWPPLYDAGPEEPGAGTAGGLAPFFGSCEPRTAVRFVTEQLTGDQISFPGLSDAPEVLSAEVVVCLHPSSVVAVLVLETAPVPLADVDAARPLTDLMEQSLAGTVRIGQLDLWDHLQRLAAPALPDPYAPAPGPHAERHQLLFLPPGPEDMALSQDLTYKLIWGRGGIHLPAFSPLWRPEELNGPAGAGAVVSRWRSVFSGHDEFVEFSLLASSIYLVGMAGHFRGMREETFRRITDFNERMRASAPGTQARVDLETLIENLADLQFDTALGMEPPEPHVAGFHRALGDALDLSGQSSKLSRTFNDLGSSLASELTAIDIRERRKAESEKNWSVISAAALSPISAAGFILAFLGINASQVDDTSMWSDQYAPLYFIATVMALVPVGLIVLPWLQDRGFRSTRRLWPWLQRWLRNRGFYSDGRLSATDVRVALLGVTVGAPAVLCAALTPVPAVVVAIAEASGLVLLALGVTSAILRGFRS